jgi:uncharacterized membrane protein YphA (DoxX/SURF4 family)
MTLVRRLARPLLAAVFVQNGVDAFLHPAPRADAVRPLAQRAAAAGLPDDPELLVRANGAVMAGAGALFALGRLPRLSALAMVATLAPTTYAEHAFWAEKDPERRRAQRRSFLENLGLLGGTLLATVDTEGRPGLAWRGRNAVHQAEKSARRATRDAKRASRQARRAAKAEAREAVRSAKEALPV